MARRKAKAGPTQKLMSYGILGVLGLICVWLLVQQSRLNPAVTVALNPPQPQSRPQGVAGQPLTAMAALFPDVPGFTPLSPVQSYGPDNLSDKIDGKAELYLAAGFKEMACRAYRPAEGEGAHVEVFLYDMDSAANAFAVFSGQRRPGAPSLSWTANAYATANALFFTRGKYYVEIVADRAAAALISSLEAYAQALLVKLPSEGEAGSPAALFPPEGLARETVRLCPTDVFGLEGLNNVFTGEYRLKSATATAFLAARETPEQAQADARRYQEFLLANGYRKVEPGGAPGKLQAFALDNSFEIVWVQGKTFAGVHDASSLEAAQELAASLEAAIKGKP